MVFFQNLPWISLALLTLTYTTFGFTLPTLPTASLIRVFATSSNVMWISAAVVALLFSAALTAPLRNTKTLIWGWSKTDTGMFVTVISLAFIAVLIVSQIHLFVGTLVLLSAAALARLDIQTAGYTERQAFWILAVASLVGLALGWAMNFYRELLGF